MTQQSENDYKSNDDLGLNDSVIESLSVDHKNRRITFILLKVVERVDRFSNYFTYKVKRGSLTFENVIFANINYGLYFDEWSEFHRSAVLKTSKLLSDYSLHLPNSIKEENLNHYYLGVDNGTTYKEIDIICSFHNLTLENEEKILHDDFLWLYERE